MSNDSQYTQPLWQASRVSHGTFNLNGVAWDQMPPPPRRHKCWPQTRIEFFGGGPRFWRCPCGGKNITSNEGHAVGKWTERNSRQEPRSTAGKAFALIRAIVIALVVTTAVLIGAALLLSSVLNRPIGEWPW